MSPPAWQGEEAELGELWEGPWEGPALPENHCPEAGAREG